ncbi:hypothetical protein ACFYP0_04720 [Micromonospora arida]|uniref:hypothetical protein n=1 Tax=Micromonospora arida TaxID=2203715 RepID=UPI0033CE8906
MAEQRRPDSNPEAEIDEQVLDLEARPGVGDGLLESLPPGAVVAYRGEPSASERAMLCWPMSEQDRLSFASGIESTSSRLQGMTGDDLDRFIGELNQATLRLRLDLEIEDEEAAGTQDSPDQASSVESSPVDSLFSRAGGIETRGAWVLGRHIVHALARLGRPIQ